MGKNRARKKKSSFSKSSKSQRIRRMREKKERESNLPGTPRIFLKMTKNQDARPFVDLRKDAEEFRIKFDEDINACLNFLDAKITALICDPDSSESLGRCIRQNNLVEFSRAKYNIFIGVKSLINAKEREWIGYIAEMKKLFIENVEIFLAGTKLEVKLPKSESVSSRGPQKSPSNSKSNTSITSSIYPIISTITKNIPVLGSSFHEKDASSAESKQHVGEKTLFSRRDKMSTSSMKLAYSFDEDEEMDMEEPELDRSRSRSSSNTRSRKSSNSDLNTSQSSSGRRNSFKKDDLGLNTSQSSSGRRSSQKFENDYESNENISVTINQTDVNTTAPVDTNNLPSKVRGRRGKLIEVNSTVEDDIKKVRGKQQKVKSGKAQNSSSDENESQITETAEKEIPLKGGRKGRSAPKAKANIPVVSKSNSSNTDEDENQTIENELPLKGRRGRSAPKAKANDLSDLVVAKNSSTSTDENENQNTETIENELSIENEVALKGRRGRSAPKAKATDLIVEVDVNQNRRGRSTTSKSIADQTAAQKITVRGRKAVHPTIDEEIYEPDQTAAQKITVRGRKVVHPAIDEDIYEPGPSKSPKKVSFGGDQSSSDEIEQTPLARPVKSAARRKTLLPNLEHISGADIIPGNPSRSKAKRKTISNVSELETAVAPSKRLKVSQKSLSIQEEDNSADDNLLESDGNYSEWMSLKSVDGKIPTRPAIYEMKVWRAKKPAYIGSCENLRQKLTLHNLRQNSGHKQLDKFIDRNYNEIQVRFEVTTSFDSAKKEAKNRVESFKAQHKNPPAYN